MNIEEDDKSAWWVPDSTHQPLWRMATRQNGYLSTIEILKLMRVPYEVLVGLARNNCSVLSKSSFLFDAFHSMPKRSDHRGNQRPVESTLNLTFAVSSILLGLVVCSWCRQDHAASWFVNISSNYEAMLAMPRWECRSAYFVQRVIAKNWTSFNQLRILCQVMAKRQKNVDDIG